MHEKISPQVEQVPQGDQVPIGGQGNDVLVVPPELSYRDIREAFLALSRVVTTQANFSMVCRMDVAESNMKYQLREFVRMNPHIFHGSKVGEDPHEFLNGVCKVLSAIAITSREKKELASYQLRNVSQVCYTQWKNNGRWIQVLSSEKNLRKLFLKITFPVREGKLR